MSPIPDLEQELNAFVDGELPPERHAALAASIARDPALQHRVDELRALQAALGQLADPLLRLPVPDRLRQAALRPPKPNAGVVRATGGRSLRWQAAAAGLALAACVGVFFLAGQPRHPGPAIPAALADPVVAEALAVRDGERAAVRHAAFAAGSDRGAPDRFVTDALGGAIHAPDLSRAGFALSEADLYEGPDGRALQLRYIDGERHVFTVYIHPGPAPDRFALLAHRALKICVWQNADLSAVMAAELPTSELFRLSSMTYSALSL